MTTATANYGWQMPDPGGSANTWGNTLNATTQAIDAQVFTNAQGVAPIGSVTLFAGPIAPANWLLCQGQSLATAGTYAALFAVIGYTYGGSGANFNLPNLGNRFPLGVGGGALFGQVGGSFSYTIATANLPSHAHPITDVTHNHGASQAPHAHSDFGHNHPDAGSSQDAHSHSIPFNLVNGSGSGLTPGGSAFSLSSGQRTDTQQPAVHISIGTGFANLASMQPAITVTPSGTGLSTTQAVGSGTAMSIVPSYVALNYIIRYQ